MDILKLLGLEQAIAQAEKASPQERYARVDIPLDNPEYIGKDIPIHVDGDFLAKIRYDGSATGAYFKFGNKRSSPIYISEFKQRHTPLSKFTQILLTNVSAQDGKHFIFNVGDGIVGDIEPSTGRKSGITDSAGDDINPATAEGLTALEGQGAVDGGGDLQKVKEELVKANTDLAALETLITAGNVDLDAIEVDLAALEVLGIAGNADLAAIETLITAGNVDLAALEVDLAALEVLGISINTAVELIDNAISGTKMQTEEQFSGTPYNKQQTSTDGMVVLYGSTKKLRDVVIKNTDAANAVDIGITQANVATFRANSFEVKAGAAIGFTMIDLNLLKILSSVAGNHATIHLIGTEI